MSLDDYDDGDLTEDEKRAEYEKGQKDGSKAGTLRSILGPGHVSRSYQAGFVNGVANPSDEDD